jgi:hypothetical protein
MTGTEFEQVVGVSQLARRAWPWLPALTKAGRIYVGPVGETLKANADGTFDVVLQGAVPWDRSAAADPTATRWSP